MIFTGKPSRDADMLNSILYYSKGDPNGVVRASPGALCLNREGGAGTTLWVKESGTGDTGWRAFPNLTTPSSSWQALTYSNGWRDYNGGGAPWGTGGYRKDASGYVHLHGLLDKNGGNWVAGEVMFTLPAGYRPGQQELFSPRMGGGGENNGRCDLTTAGQFTVVAGGLANPVNFVSLAGISFLAEN